MNENPNHRHRSGGDRRPLLVLALAVLLGGCDLEVLNPGAILDEDLNAPELMPIVVAGVAAEFNDVVDEYAAFDVARLSDEMAGTGSYFDTGRMRRGVFDDEDSENAYQQIHEAAWSADRAWERLQDVLGDDAEGVLSARVFMLEGFAHRYMGELFCEVTYDEGPLEPRSGAFDRAIAAFETAIQHAGSDPDAAEFATAAHAGLAQAYVGLGDWSSAVAQASQVPTDFVLEALYNRNANQNLVFNETHGRAEIGVYGTLAARFEGDQDPRAPFTKCGEFVDRDDPSQGVTSTGAPGCTAHQGADGLTAHWRQEKHDDWGSDVAVAKGTEMRLIEAEAALRQGDLGTFTARINDVRDFYDLEPIDQPAAVGELEFPNAFDDAWSILDAERWLTLWLEGRRLWDLHRWDHPFLNGGTVIYPGEARRASCMPIPELECQLNTNLSGQTVKTSTGGTKTCG